MSYYKRLKSDLDSCREKGIINSQTADKIYNAVYSKNYFASIKASEWIAILAGIFITVGISLIIAHNWDKMPDISKMAGFIILYALVAETAIRTFKSKEIISAPAEIIWFFAPLIGIGLYAQIFNLSGDPAKPYLAWLVISSPLAFFSKRKALPFLHIISIFILLLFSNFTGGNMLSLIQADYYGAEKLIFSNWLWSLALICAAFAAYFAKLKNKILIFMLGGFLFWIFLFLIYPTPFAARGGGLKLTAAVSLLILWINSGEIFKSESRLPFASWFFAMYIVTFLWHWKNTVHSESLASIILASLLVVSAVILSAKSFFKFRKEFSPAKNAGKILLAASPLIVLPAAIYSNPLILKTIAVTANILLILAGLILIMDGAKAFNEKRINTGVFVIFAVIITRFFDIFGTMLKSGIAFIFVGILMILLSYFINKGRKAIIEAAKK